MFILLFILWIVFNGKVTLEIVLVGFVVSGLVYAFICKFMDYSIKEDIFMLKKLPLYVHYALVLIYEIIVANFLVIKLITSFNVQAEPVIVHFKTNLKSTTAKVVLANSITLTPGTITASLEEDEYVVHCMDKDFANGLSDSRFVKLLEKIEKKGDHRYE